MLESPIFIAKYTYMSHSSCITHYFGSHAFQLSHLTKPTTCMNRKISLKIYIYFFIIIQY